MSNVAGAGGSVPGDGCRDGLAGAPEGPEDVGSIYDDGGERWDVGAGRVHEPDIAQAGGDTCRGPRGASACPALVRRSDWCKSLFSLLNRG
eukprot:7729731-Pyramimonas_sp.AAC.2